MKTVLVIDGNEQERDVFSRFLRFVGGRVEEADDGVEGLRLAGEHLPDLILLDVSLPGMDGWETLRRLKAAPRTSWIPVVATTARHVKWDARRGAGFFDYLEKPIAPYRVLEKVEQCIGRLDCGDPRVVSERNTRAWAWESPAAEPRPARPAVERRRAERRRAVAGSYTGPERRRGIDRRGSPRPAGEWLYIQAG